jgi:cyclopropane-fatty-acyl-phospholipid synthase
MTMKSASTPTSTEMRPHFEEIQAHYDLSDDFFGVFQDPSRTYSCAFFERDDMTLEEAQLAKIDLALGKLDLQPGMTLLDVGCGWGSVMKRAIEKYDVNVVGLTLSKNQYTYCARLLDDVDTQRSRRVSLHGWEEFDDPVDRIVSIEAFEAFPKERYGAFFETCHRILPGGGRMVLQTIMGHPLKRWPEMGIPIVMSDLKFMRFLRCRTPRSSTSTMSAPSTSGPRTSKPLTTRLSLRRPRRSTTATCAT